MRYLSSIYLFFVLISNLSILLRIFLCTNVFIINCPTFNKLYFFEPLMKPTSLSKDLYDVKILNGDYNANISHPDEFLDLNMVQE